MPNRRTFCNVITNKLIIDLEKFGLILDLRRADEQVSCEGPEGAVIAFGDAETTVLDTLLPVLDTCVAPLCEHLHLNFCIENKLRCQTLG